MEINNLSADAFLKFANTTAIKDGDEFTQENITKLTQDGEAKEHAISLSQGGSKSVRNELLGVVKQALGGKNDEVLGAIREKLFGSREEGVETAEAQKQLSKRDISMVMKLASETSLNKKIDDEFGRFASSMMLKVYDESDDVSLEAGNDAVKTIDSQIRKLKELVNKKLDLGTSGNALSMSDVSKIVEQVRTLADDLRGKTANEFFAMNDEALSKLVDETITKLASEEHPAVEQQPEVKDGNVDQQPEVKEGDVNQQPEVKEDNVEPQEEEIVKNPKPQTEQPEGVKAAGEKPDWQGTKVQGAGWDAFKAIAEDKWLSDDKCVFFEGNSKTKLVPDYYDRSQPLDRKLAGRSGAMRAQLLKCVAEQLKLSSDEVQDPQKNKTFDSIRNMLLDAEKVDTPLSKSDIVEVIKLVDPNWVKPELTSEETQKREIVKTKLAGLSKPLSAAQKEFLKKEADDFRKFYHDLYNPNATELARQENEAGACGLGIENYRKLRFLDYQVKVAIDPEYQRKALELFGDICSPVTTEELEDAHYEVETARCEQENPITVLKDKNGNTDIQISSGLKSMEGEPKAQFLAGDCRWHQGLRGSNTQEEATYNQYSMVTTAINLAKGNIKLDLHATYGQGEVDLKLYYFKYEKDNSGLDKINPFTGFLQRQFLIADSAGKPLDKTQDSILVACSAPDLGYKFGYEADDPHNFDSVQANRQDNLNLNAKDRPEKDVADDVEKIEGFYDYFMDNLKETKLEENECQYKNLYAPWQIGIFKKSRPVSARDDAMMIAAFGKYINVKSGDPKAEFEKLIDFIKKGDYKAELDYALDNFKMTYGKQIKRWLLLLAASKAKSAMLFGIGLNAFHNPESVFMQLFSKYIHEIGGLTKWYTHQKVGSLGQDLNKVINALQDKGKV